MPVFVPERHFFSGSAAVYLRNHRDDRFITVVIGAGGHYGYSRNRKCLKGLKCFKKTITPKKPIMTVKVG